MVSKPIPLVLNQQVIKIMEDIAILVDWFFKLQKHYLLKLHAATTTTAVAAKFVKQHNIAPVL